MGNSAVLRSAILVPKTNKHVYNQWYAPWSRGWTPVLLVPDTMFDPLAKEYRTTWPQWGVEQVSPLLFQSDCQGSLKSLLNRSLLLSTVFLVCNKLSSDQPCHGSAYVDAVPPLVYGGGGAIKAERLIILCRFWGFM